MTWLFFLVPFGVVFSFGIAVLLRAAFASKSAMSTATAVGGATSSLTNGKKWLVGGIILGIAGVVVLTLAFFFTTDDLAWWGAVVVLTAILLYAGWKSPVVRYVAGTLVMLLCASILTFGWDSVRSAFVGVHEEIVSSAQGVDNSDISCTSSSPEVQAAEFGRRWRRVVIADGLCADFSPISRLEVRTPQGRTPQNSPLAEVRAKGEEPVWGTVNCRPTGTCSR